VGGWRGGVVFGSDLGCSTSIAPLGAVSGDASDEPLSPAWTALTAGAGRRRTASRMDCDLAFFRTSAFCSSQAA